MPKVLLSRLHEDRTTGCWWRAWVEKLTLPTGDEALGGYGDFVQVV